MEGGLDEDVSEITFDLCVEISEVEMVCFFKLLYVDVIPGGSRRFREYSVLLFTVPMSGVFFF